MLESGKVVPRNLRREFEKVTKYNEATNKNNENEKNNYLEDFEEPDDSVLNKKIADDVGVQNNLMRNGTVNNDDVDLEDIGIRWDQKHDFSEKVQAYREGTDLKRLERIIVFLRNK